MSFESDPSGGARYRLNVDPRPPFRTVTLSTADPPRRDRALLRCDVGEVYRSVPLPPGEQAALVRRLAALFDRCGARHDLPTRPADMPGCRRAGTREEGGDSNSFHLMSCHVIPFSSSSILSFLDGLADFHFLSFHSIPWHVIPISSISFSLMSLPMVSFSPS